MKTLGCRVLSLVLLAASVKAGADHDVMQVKSPHVVKHPLGPSMEVHRQKPSGLSNTFREMRNANLPSYNRGCFSCATGTFGSSDYSSGSAYSSGGLSGAGAYGVPQSTSSRQEFRREQKYVNGQPVYDLHHERHFEDGRLVHEEKSEKDEDDFGVSQGSSAAAGSHSYGSNFNWHTRPGFTRRWEETSHKNYTVGSQGHGIGFGTRVQGSDEHSSNFNAEIARLHELHRQQGAYVPQPHLTPSGSSHRTEVHSETRYVNGQPIYVRKEERKYKDGKLVHDQTEEKGAKDLGTEGLQTVYDSSGAPISGGSTGGFYEHRRHSWEEQARGESSQYPASPYYGNAQPSDRNNFNIHSSLSSSHSDDRPVYSGNTGQYSQEHYSYTNSQRTDGSYPTDSRLPVGSYISDSHRSEGIGSSSSSSDRDESRQSSGRVSSSSYNRQESYDRLSPSSSPYRPTPEDSPTHYSQDSRNPQPSYPSSGSTNQYDQRRWESSSTHSSHRPSSHTTSQGGSSEVYRGEAHGSLSSSSYPSNRQPSVSSTYHVQSSQDNSPSYPYHQPSVGSTSTQVREDDYRASSSYPSYRPSSEGSSTRLSEETHRTSSYGSSSRTDSSSYPSYTPSEDRSSTSYSEERRESSSYGSRSRESSDQHNSSTEDLEETRVLQNVPESPTYSTHTNVNTINQESSRNYDEYYRPARPDSSSHLDSSHSSSTETRYRGREHGGFGYPSSGQRNRGGVSFNVDSSLTDQRMDTRQNTNQYGTETGHTSVHGEERRSYHSRTQAAVDREESPVGIPGVISGPHTSSNDGDFENKERYDISPLDDVLPDFPDVGNEIDTSLIPTLPSVDSEVESPVLGPGSSHSDVPDDLHHDRFRGSNIIDENRNDDSSGRQQQGVVREHSRYLYNDTHTIYGRPIAPSIVDQSRYDYSHASSSDESRRTHPITSGSSQYHYNETRRHSTIIGGQPNTHPALTSGSSSLSSSDCTQINGCSVGSVQSSSRRSEIRTSKRYVNGKLVGVTHYERLYENGKLVHENVTEQGVDELTPQELRKYGIDQLNLVHGSYQPGSYSQRHEVKQEKKYVNGQQVYGLHHERRYEDGKLVHENRTENDEDDFGGSPGGADHLGLPHSSSQFDGANRHEVTQSQHLQQHVTSDSRPGSVGRSSQTHQVSDTSNIIAKPVYTTRRHETRRQQEYINGQPVYDLHHERRYHDGSLVYENRTELDEKDAGGSSGGHHDALHQIMSGSTLNTASESTYDRNAGASGAGHYDSYSGSSYGGSSASQVGGSYEGSSVSSSSAHGSSQTYGRSGSSSGSSLTAGESLLTSGGSSLTHSGGATTTIFGNSLEQGSSGSGSSSRHHESSYTASQESSRGGLGGSLLTSGGSSLTHSGGASTTILGSSLGQGSTGGGSSSRHHESSYTTSQESSRGNTGCLTCMLVGGPGYSSQGSSSSASSHAASHSYSGSYGGGVGGGVNDGYSQRRESQREEYYENGQLVHGQEEDRRFQDGQLVQENRRQYSEIPGQISNARALQSAGTSYASSSSSEASSHSFSSSSGGGSRFGGRVTVKGDTTGVCDPSPCQNGGTCIAGLKGPLCVCTFGFKGTRCDEVYCPRRFCRYGGKCTVTDGRHECACKNGFMGPRCQKRGSGNA